jgi:tetratricopeptide (TPR) repeat protein
MDAKMTLAYLYKGGVCNRLGRYDEALECYERALQAQEEGK